MFGVRHMSVSDTFTPTQCDCIALRHFLKLSFSQIIIVDYIATCVMSGVNTSKKLQR